MIAYLQPDQAAEVLSGLPDDLQGEVALRLTNMQPADPEFIKHVDTLLRERVYGEGFQDPQRRVPDVSRLERLTGFRPERSIRDAVRDLLTMVAGSPVA